MNIDFPMPCALSQKKFITFTKFTSSLMAKVVKVFILDKPNSIGFDFYAKMFINNNVIDNIEVRKK